METDYSASFEKQRTASHPRERGTDENSNIREESNASYSRELHSSNSRWPGDHPLRCRSSARRSRSPLWYGICECRCRVRTGNRRAPVSFESPSRTSKSCREPERLCCDDDDEDRRDLSKGCGKFLGTWLARFRSSDKDVDHRCPKDSRWSRPEP